MDINSKSVCLTIEPEDFLQLKNNLTSGNIKLNFCDYIIDNENQLILYNTRKNMKFRNGTESLKRLLKLSKMPSLVKLDSSKFLSIVNFGLENDSVTIEDDIAYIHGSNSRIQIMRLIMDNLQQ